jgi:predicted  nucleic acid-binding Zn-ribbon protein
MLNALKVVALLGLCLVVIGCANQSELPPQTTQQLVDLRDGLTQGKAQIQTTCNNARDLTQRPQAQIEPQITRLQTSIKELEERAAGGRKGYSTAREQSQAYFAKWEEQLQGMSRNLADQGEARRADSMASFKELEKRVETLRGEFRPFMDQVLEVSKYLETDPTASGVKAVNRQMQQALGRENNLMAKADAVIQQIDKMRGGK